MSPQPPPVLSPIMLSQLRRGGLSRRRLLAMLGGLAGGAVLIGCSGSGGSSSGNSVSADTDDDSLDTTGSSGNGGCTITPSATEGPFFVDEQLNRSDIRPNTSGVAEANVSSATPLHLSLSVYDASSSACTPLPNVQIDVWHCHAGGLYSDISSGQSSNTSGQDFLRGYQVSDSNGQVRFTSIYPGWYAGRTAHIHIKARIYKLLGNSTLTFNTQGFFDDAITDQVMSAPPYSTRGARSTRNDNDGIYGGRSALLFQLSQNSDGSWNGALSIGLNA